jgi:hypothetical protein
MVYIFLILILGFALSSIWYAYQNSFAKETLVVIFPAIGAILLSGYLGYKSIFVDNPPPKTFGVPVAILYDQPNGMIRGMGAEASSERPFEFRGALALDFIPHDPDFADLHLSDSLRDTSGELSSARTTNLIKDILEFAVLKWLNTPDLLVGVPSGFAIQLIIGGGAVGGPIPMDDLVPVETSLGADEPNSLLRARAIQLLLPKGSRVFRSAQQRHSIEIDTGHSLLRIRILGFNAERLGRPPDSARRRIYAALGLPANPTGVAVYGFRFELETSQVSYSRYSDQAKKEALWLAKIGESLERDFSWARLRAFYSQ